MPSRCSRGAALQYAEALSEATEYRRGLAFGIAAYGLWGVVPAFWKLVDHVDAVELLAHRAVWGLITFAAIIAIAKQLPALRRAAREPRTLAQMALSGGLLAVNWGVFVYAVASNHLLDASLGYFINPLVSIALGTLVLGERLRRLQWVAIVLAASGVAAITWSAGGVPWIALVLASTFGLYGLVRKTARVDSLVGSTIETALLAPLAVAYLAVLAAGDRSAIAHADVTTHALLVATGVVTVVPLLLFTSSARRLPLATVGFLQYLAPTGQFLLAVVAYGEPFARDKLVAFVLIWAGLAAFSYDAIKLASRGMADR